MILGIIESLFFGGRVVPFRLASFTLFVFYQICDGIAIAIFRGNKKSGPWEIAPAGPIKRRNKKGSVLRFLKGLDPGLVVGDLLLDVVYLVAVFCHAALDLVQYFL